MAAAQIKTREQLRPKFANGKKPPQEDFWDWQESYWHKYDDIDAASVKVSIDGQKKNIVTLLNEAVTVIADDLQWAELTYS